MELYEEGYRFHPTDSELLTFLLRFLAQQPLRDDDYISHLDVYKHEPWVTYDNGRHCGGEDDRDTSICRYFISPRHKNKEENGRFKRTVLGVCGKVGSWKQQDKGKKVMTMNNRNNAAIIGYKKSLSYEPTEKSDCPDDGKWLMKEYSLCETMMKRLTNSAFRNYIICSIKRKCKKGSSDGPGRSSVLTIRDFSNEEKVDISGVNSFDQRRMDQEYNVVECQGASSSGVKNDDVLWLTTTTQIQQFRTSEMLEINLPAHDLPEDCVNEDHTAYWEVLANHTTSFVELLTGGDDSIRNNQVNPDDELMTHFNFFEQATVESNQENGPLGLTAPLSQIPEIFDRGDTLLEKHQTQNPPEESETLWETEEISSMVADLAEELLDHTPIKDRLDAINSTVMLDQQSWQSKMHLEDMLPLGPKNKG